MNNVLLFSDHKLGLIIAKAVASSLDTSDATCQRKT